MYTWCVENYNHIMLEKNKQQQNMLSDDSGKFWIASFWV